MKEKLKRLARELVAIAEEICEMIDDMVSSRKEAHHE